MLPAEFSGLWGMAANPHGDGYTCHEKENRDKISDYQIPVTVGKADCEAGEIAGLRICEDTITGNVCVCIQKPSGYGEQCRNKIRF